MLHTWEWERETNKEQIKNAFLWLYGAKLSLSRIHLRKHTLWSNQTGTDVWPVIPSNNGAEQLDIERDIA